MEVLNVTDTNTKEILVQMINQVIDDSQWSSKETAHILQTALSDISRIRNSKAANFSLARLLTFLVRLGYKVTIIVNSEEVVKYDINGSELKLRSKETAWLQQYYGKTR